MTCKLGLSALLPEKSPVLPLVLPRPLLAPLCGLPLQEVVGPPLLPQSNSSLLSQRRNQTDHSNSLCPVTLQCSVYVLIGQFDFKVYVHGTSNLTSTSPVLRTREASAVPRASAPSSLALLLVFICVLFTRYAVEHYCMRDWLISRRP